MGRNKSTTTEPSKSAAESVGKADADLVEVNLGGETVKMPSAAAAALGKLRAAKDEGDATSVSGDLVVIEGKVLIDYNGVIARPPGQDEILHVDTPLLYPWPEAERLELVLQPGLNLLDPEHWTFYADKPQIRPMVNTGEIKALPGLPERESDLKDLITRTRSPEALVWMEEAITGKKADYYDHARLEDRAEILLKLLAKQLGSTNRLDYEPQPMRIPLPNYGKPVERGLAMGT